MLAWRRERSMKAMTAARLLFDILLRREGEEYARYVWADRLSSLICPRYKFSDFGRIYLDDADFLRYHESFDGKANYHCLDRRYTLDQLVKVTRRVPGDTAECGVFQGASSWLICRRTKGTGKAHHVFDSFEGLSKPQAADGSYWRQGEFSADEASVKARLKEFDFVTFHKGWIPEKFIETSDRRFSFLHVDVDLYQPTLASLRFFYERMNPGGVIVCDEYGLKTCPGAKKAMDDFFGDRQEEIVALTTGQGLVIKEMATFR